MRIDKNLVAIVTGGASGLGEATVQLLASKEAKIVVADLNVQAGEQLAKKVNGSFFKTNVADEKNVKQLLEFTKKTYGKVNVVINCAGVVAIGTIIYSKGVASTQQMQRVLKINVIGTFNVSKWAAKYMSQQEEVEGQRGLIINVASVAGEDGQKGQTIYSASKGAIIGMTLPMARDLGKLKIRVTTIAPGIFETPMGTGMQKKVVDGLLNSTPLGRLGKASEFALMAEAMIVNSYVTGSVWRLDGGIRLPYL